MLIRSDRTSAQLFSVTYVLHVLLIFSFFLSLSYDDVILNPANTKPGEKKITVIILFFLFLFQSRVIIKLSTRSYLQQKNKKTWHMHQHEQECTTHKKKVRHQPFFCFRSIKLLCKPTTLPLTIQSTFLLSITLLWQKRWFNVDTFFLSRCNLCFFFVFG